MGGNYSSPQNRVEGIPSDEITFKEYDRSKPDDVCVPCPLAARSSYHSLFNDSGFKTFVFEHFDSNALISSILQNIEQESLVLNGIAYHQSLNRSDKTQLYFDINKFQSFPLAGIHVS
jgi:hypothetical protein